jgi:hypothetical protein
MKTECKVLPWKKDEALSDNGWNIPIVGLRRLLIVRFAVNSFTPSSCEFYTRPTALRARLYSARSQEVTWSVMCLLASRNLKQIQQARMTWQAMYIFHASFNLNKPFPLWHLWSLWWWKFGLWCSGLWRLVDVDQPQSSGYVQTFSS